jgi:hypothetical protein
MQQGHHTSGLDWVVPVLLAKTGLFGCLKKPGITFRMQN